MMGKVKEVWANIFDPPKIESLKAESQYLKNQLEKQREEDVVVSTMPIYDPSTSAGTWGTLRPLVPMSGGSWGLPPSTGLAKTTVTAWPTPASYVVDSWKEDLKDVLKFCIDNDIWIRRTGSQLIEDIEPNDMDYVAEDIDGKLVPYLEQNGYWLGGSSRPEAQFMSWKKGEVNIIVCHDREYFRKYLMATELLKKMQPKTKQERINIFDTIFGTNNKDTDVPF